MPRCNAFAQSGYKNPASEENLELPIDGAATAFDVYRRRYADFSRNRLIYVHNSDGLFVNQLVLVSSLAMAVSQQISSYEILEMALEFDQLRGLLFLL